MEADDQFGSALGPDSREDLKELKKVLVSVHTPGVKKNITVPREPERGSQLGSVGQRTEQLQVDSGQGAAGKVAGLATEAEPTERPPRRLAASEEDVPRATKLGGEKKSVALPGTYVVDAWYE